MISTIKNVAKYIIFLQSHPCFDKKQQKKRNHSVWMHFFIGFILIGRIWLFHPPNDLFLLTFQVVLLLATFVTF